MGMREKLIELIQTASSTCPDGIHKCPDCEYYEKDAFGNPCNDTKRIADHLIANGVTIPVRCKDCWKRFVPFECGLWQGMVNGNHLFLSKGDYFWCAYGERKNNDE